MWAVIISSGKRWQTETRMNMHKLKGKKIKPNGLRTLPRLWFFLPVDPSLPLPVCPQLLPFAAAGGCCGLEDQAKLLGVTATRGRSHRLQIMSFGVSFWGIYNHLKSFPVHFRLVVAHFITYWKDNVAHKARK